ncbi:hypothetical protein [Moraxella atlantae]|nr:hypothetical protein [Moraxella atlantae]
MTRSMRLPSLSNQIQDNRRHHNTHFGKVQTLPSCQNNCAINGVNVE